MVTVHDMDASTITLGCDFFPEITDCFELWLSVQLVKSYEYLLCQGKFICITDEGGIVTVRRKPRREYTSSDRHHIRSRHYQSQRGSFQFEPSKANGIRSV